MLLPSLFCLEEMNQNSCSVDLFLKAAIKGEEWKPVKSDSSAPKKQSAVPSQPPSHPPPRAPERRNVARLEGQERTHY